MRTVIGGDGSDTTAACAAFLASNKQIWQADLYLIGEPDDPQAFWLTNYESPLLWSPWGTFKSTVISRDQLGAQIGLESTNLGVTWSPQNIAVTSSLATANPYQLAQLGWFDNRRLRIWRTIMPTPGDANTFGAYERFAGFIGSSEPQRGKIVFSVNDYLYVLDQKVPSGVIEVTNTLASYQGGTPPAGYSVMPQFNIIAGSTPTRLICDQISPNPHNVPSGNVWAGAFVVFNGGGSSTLAGQYSVILGNGAYDDGNGNHYTSLSLASPLPWAPTPAVDTFYVSAQNPLNQADGDYFGFPYVPAPQTAV